MNILLSHGYFLQDDPKEQKIMRPYVPLGILYISAYLEQHGFENDVFDTTFSSKTEFEQHLLVTKPSIVGLYTNLVTKVNILSIFHFIKQNLPETIIILGGPDVRYNAENYLRHGVDYIVMGEGEQTMLALVQHIVHQQGELSAIAGVAYLRDGALVQNAEREKLKNLDDLPLPNRKKVNLHLYLDTWKKFHGKGTMSVSTMRGCPYTCKWCSRGVYGLSYRRRSPEKVADELDMLKREYNPDSLWFVDDVFTISHKWLEEFRNELKNRNLRIPYECITRADRMNEEVLGMLKETGCFRVWIGAESGSQKIIDLMDRRVDVNRVRDMIRLSKKYNIESGTFIMLGYPGETEEDIEETIHHLKQSNPDHFTITVAYPIKGTELYQEVESSQTTHLDWAQSTDRMIDFKRTYSRKYYDYAVKRVISEINYFKSKKSNSVFQTTKLKIKSLAAKAGMKYEKLISG